MCPPEFLMWSLYKELCRPKGSGFRWEKIYTRYLVFYNYFHVKDTPGALVDKSAKTSSGLVQKLTAFIKQKGYTVVGHYAVQLHTGKPCKMLNSMPEFEILSTDIDEVFNEMKNSLGVDLYLKKTHSNSFYEVTSYYASVVYEGVNLCRIYLTDACYSYQSLGGFHVGTIDTVLHFLYGNLITADHFNTLNGSLSNALRKLIVLLEKYADESGPEDRLKLNCIGHEKTITDMKKELWDKKIFHYRPASS